MSSLVIFSDLDGTLLDAKTYSFEKALSALDFIKRLGVPLILCSSKTRVEIEYYRAKLSNPHPFVSENGGGIFVPQGYFGPSLLRDAERDGEYDVIRLGARYPELRSALSGLKAGGFPLTGFGDMSVQEVADLAHMTRDEAAMAKQRDFDEPFVFHGPEEELPRLFSEIIRKRFTYTKGRFFHILGNSDKGRAVSILTELYSAQYGDIETIALGDSPNDLPMLEKVDIPVVVQREDGSYDPAIDLPNVIKASGIGPEGWNRAVLEILTNNPCRGQ